MTETARYYAILDMEEATEYLMDEELGGRLTTLCKALLALETSDAHEIFRSLDDLKLRSSMTLLDAVPATFPLFGQVLDKFYSDKRDELTLQLLRSNKA